MNSKERELRQQMAVKKEEFRVFINDNKLDEAEGVKNELQNMQRALDLMKDVDDIIPPVSATAETKAQSGEAVVDTRVAFAKALRGGRNMTEEELNFFTKEARALNEGTDTAGGFIVPQDIQTAINQFKREFLPLTDLIRVENVNTMSGARTFESVATVTPLAVVDELGNIGETDQPSFKRITYTIKKYGGILPISKELLADTDQTLLAYVLRWLAMKEVATHNKYILDVLKTFSATTIAGLDDIKKVLNITLDPAISVQSTIVTNQTGFHFLQTLKDSDGRYLMVPDPLQPNAFMFAGQPIIKRSNTNLPNEGNNAPIIVGSLKDAVTLFDRQAQSVEGTSIGGNAFIRDSYDLKYITRFDVKKVDEQAAVFGSIATA